MISALATSTAAAAFRQGPSALGKRVQGREAAPIDSAAAEPKATTPPADGTPPAGRPSGETAARSTPASDPLKAGEDLKIASEIRRLINWENQVKQHEQAHMAVGGEFAGAASYSYTTGPDGKRYISGGEVSISVPATDDPNEAVRMLEQVKRAALAPADPSPQDIRTASAAASKQARAYAELAKAREAASTENSK